MPKIEGEKFRKLNLIFLVHPMDCTGLCETTVNAHALELSFPDQGHILFKYETFDMDLLLFKILDFMILLK